MATRSRTGKQIMGHFEHISAEAANALLQADAAQLVDIRDEPSFTAGHIKGARHLDNSSLQDFVREADPDLAVIVCCYHGNSSQPAAAFLSDKGFEEVYSLDGGVERWRAHYPIETTTP